RSARASTSTVSRARTTACRPSAARATSQTPWPLQHRAQLPPPHRPTPPRRETTNMTAIALIMMVLFILVIWGGLVGSIIMLTNSTDEESGELGTAQAPTTRRSPPFGCPSPRPR